MSGSEVSALAPLEPKRRRGPSKKQLLKLAAEYERGFNEGINRPRSTWPGATAALVLALAAYVAGALIH